MPNPATAEDVADRWRPLTSTEESTATTLLDDAWWLLTSRLPSLESNVAAGTVLEGNVIRVLASMVVRVMRNPDGYLQESLDDWSGRRHDLTASGVLHLTGDEAASLTPSGFRSVRSVRLTIHGDA